MRLISNFTDVVHANKNEGLTWYFNKSQMSSLGIMSCLVDSNSYKRLQSLNDYVYTSMSYDEFVQWNINCLHELSTDDIRRVEGICQFIYNERVSIVGLGNCSETEAHGIYFNMNKRLCIFSR